MDLFCFNALGLTDVTLLKTTGQKHVYTATSPVHGKIILKVVKPGQNTERIKREIEILKGCREFNTSTIYDDNTIICEDEEYFYILESFIEGENLRDFISHRGTINYDEVTNFLQTILYDLTILEQRNLVHRDIKPENIMRTSDGQYFLIDFGIARDLNKESLTDTNSTYGPHTLGYAPMEQIDNEKTNINSQTDIYSTGVIAYEMLTGINPFIDGCESVAQVIRKVQKGKVDFLSSEDSKEIAINELIHSCMNRYRSKRPKTAKEAFDWLQDTLNKGAE